MNKKEFSPEALNDICEDTADEPMNCMNLGRYEVFESGEARVYALRTLCRHALPSEAVERLIEMGFLSAPASTKYHGNYDGGLFDHSYAVATTLMDMTSRLGLQWQDPLSPIRVGILHDLCKGDQYEYNFDKNV